jgi:DNA-binding NtrC family response regulator
MTLYDWPGNVRELENEVKRALVLSSHELILLEDLSDAVRAGESWAPPSSEPLTMSSDGKKLLKDRVAALEMQMIRDALEETGGDRRAAAKLLGLSHQGVINKVKRYGLG